MTAKPHEPNDAIEDEIVDPGEEVEETPGEPAAGQYWIRVAGKQDHATEPKIGDRVLVTEYEDELHVAFGKTTWTWDVEEFLRDFRYHPAGPDEVLADFGTLLGEMSAENLAMDEALLGTDALGENIPLLPGETATPAEPGTDLAMTKPAAVAATREKMRGLRLALKRYRMQATRQAEKLTTLMEQQRALLARRVKRMEAAVARAEEAVWTLNLYLGRDEEIVRLRKGAKPPAETKIVIRQLVLYMDEECAFAAESGGMDHRDIPDFDKWLLNPKHLQQVLPEPRGVVAIKPRREDKDYGNPWENQARNAENRKTYWLIRNGENLYRIWTELDVGEYIVPLADEFDKLMRADPFWSSFRHVQCDPPKPGSVEWMKAMKRVDARRRHYMRILLFLQGLIDRTKVFWPLPGDRINIMRERVHAEHVDYVYDGEPTRLLGHGRPEFRKWQRDLNSRLEIGHRIVGAFPSGYDDEGKDRVHPRGAGIPTSLALYPIAGRRGRSHVILFERNGTIYPRDYREEPHDPKRRASYSVHPGDRFYLNFDLTTAEDMEFYLADRLNRRGYVEMFPVLKAALRMKAKEAHEEEPFRKLLAGEILKLGQVSIEEAEAAVAALVPWWKHKTREHRALLSDDAKALRMIVGEFERRWKRTHDGRDHAGTLATLRVQYPDAMLIAYRGAGHYVVLQPERTSDNLFLSETHWKNGQETEVRRWTVRDARPLSWLTLHATERWTNWRTDVRADEHLTDPEIAQVPDLVRAQIAEYDAQRGKGESSDLSHLFAISLEDEEIHSYCSHAKHYWSSKRGDPLSLTKRNHNWQRGANGLILLPSDSAWAPHFHDRPWTHGNSRVLWHDAAAIEHLQKLQIRADRKRERSNRTSAEAHWIAQQIHDGQARLREAAAREAYRVEYGDDDTFDEEHKKVDWTADIHWSESMRRAADLAVAKKLPYHGWTLARLIDEVTKLGWSAKTDDAADAHNVKLGIGFPLDLVLVGSREHHAKEDEDSEPEETDPDDLDDETEE